MREIYIKKLQNKRAEAWENIIKEIAEILKVEYSFEVAKSEYPHQARLIECAIGKYRFNNKNSYLENKVWKTGTSHKNLIKKIENKFNLKINFV